MDLPNQFDSGFFKVNLQHQLVFPSDLNCCNEPQCCSMADETCSCPKPTLDGKKYFKVNLTFKRNYTAYMNVIRNKLSSKRPSASPPTCSSCNGTKQSERKRRQHERNNIPKFNFMVNLLWHIDMLERLFNKSTLESQTNNLDLEDTDSSILVSSSNSEISNSENECETKLNTQKMLQKLNCIITDHLRRLDRQHRKEYSNSMNKSNDRDCEDRFSDSELECMKNIGHIRHCLEPDIPNRSHQQQSSPPSLCSEPSECRYSDNELAEYHNPCSTEIDNEEQNCCKQVKNEISSYTSKTFACKATNIPEKCIYDSSSCMSQRNNEDTKETNMLENQNISRADRSTQVDLPCDILIQRNIEDKRKLCYRKGANMQICKFIPRAHGSTCIRCDRSQKNNENKIEIPRICGSTCIRCDMSQTNNENKIEIPKICGSTCVPCDILSQRNNENKIETDRKQYNFQEPSKATMTENEVVSCSCKKTKEVKNETSLELQANAGSATEEARTTSFKSGSLRFTISEQTEDVKPILDKPEVQNTVEKENVQDGSLEEVEKSNLNEHESEESLEYPLVESFITNINFTESSVFEVPEDAKSGSKNNENFNDTLSDNTTSTRVSSVSFDSLKILGKFKNQTQSNKNNKPNTDTSFDTTSNRRSSASQPLESEFQEEPKTGSNEKKILNADNSSPETTSNRGYSSELFEIEEEFKTGKNEDENLNTSLSTSSDEITGNEDKEFNTNNSSPNKTTDNRGSLESRFCTLETYFRHDFQNFNKYDILYPIYKSSKETIDSKNNTCFKINRSLSDSGFNKVDPTSNRDLKETITNKNNSLQSPQEPDQPEKCIAFTFKNNKEHVDKSGNSKSMSELNKQKESTNNIDKSFDLNFKKISQIENNFDHCSNFGHQSQNDLGICLNDEMQSDVENIQQMNENQVSPDNDPKTGSFQCQTNDTKYFSNTFNESNSQQFCFSDLETYNNLECGLTKPKNLDLGNTSINHKCKNKESTTGEKLESKTSKCYRLQRSESDPNVLVIKPPEDVRYNECHNKLCQHFENAKVPHCFRIPIHNPILSLQPNRLSPQSSKNKLYSNQKISSYIPIKIRHYLTIIRNHLEKNIEKLINYLGAIFGMSTKPCLVLPPVSYCFENNKHIGISPQQHNIQR